MSAEGDLGLFLNAPKAYIVCQIDSCTHHGTEQSEIC